MDDDTGSFQQQGHQKYRKRNRSDESEVLLTRVHGDLAHHFQKLFRYLGRSSSWPRTPVVLAGTLFFSSCANFLCTWQFSYLINKKLSIINMGCGAAAEILKKIML